MSYVFISYNRKDSLQAMKVVKLLAEANVQTWIDTENITPGKEWRQEIDDGIRKAFAVIVIWTPNATANYITYEWSFALGAGIEVIPLIFITHRMHARMMPLQYLKVEEKDWGEKLVKRLVELDERYRDPRRRPADANLVRDAELNLNIQQLKNRDERERQRAAYALSEIRDPRAIPALVEAMSFEDTQDDMIEAIGKIGHVNGVEPLLRFIKQKVQTDRSSWSSMYSGVQQAVKALIDIGELAVPGILKNLHINNAWETLGQAIIKIGEPSLPHLVKALSDTNMDTRSIALSSIGEILQGNRDTPEDIIIDIAKQLSTSNNDVVGAAKEALQQIGSEKALEALAKYKSSK